MKNALMNRRNAMRMIAVAVISAIATILFSRATTSSDASCKTGCANCPSQNGCTKKVDVIDLSK